MHILRTILGLGLVGYGALIAIGVIAHEALLAGILSLLVGVALLIPGLPKLRVGRGRWVAAIGITAAGGVIAYNLATTWDLGLPEIGLLAYGIALIAAAGHLHREVGRTDVATLVGWSFPVLLAPLVLFALNAVLSGQSGSGAGAAAQPIIIYTLVIPMAATLTLFGTPTEVVRDNVILETSNGSLALGVGLVCAGLYPMVLFMGILGLHAWRSGMSKGRFAAYLGVGLVGLYAMNLARLVMLAKIGQAYGGEALQTAHAHLGWILFALFMVAFWGVVLRRIEGDPGKQGPKRPPERSDDVAPLVES